MTKKDKNGLLIAVGAAIILIVWLSKKVKSDNEPRPRISVKPLEEMTDQELRELLAQLEEELCAQQLREGRKGQPWEWDRNNAINLIFRLREAKATGQTNCPTPEQIKCKKELREASKGLNFGERDISEREGMRMICPHSNEGHTMTMHPTLRKRLEKLGWEYDDWLPSGKPKLPRTQSFCNAN